MVEGYSNAFNAYMRKVAWREKKKKPGAYSKNTKYSHLSGIQYKYKGITKDQSWKKNSGYVKEDHWKSSYKNWNFYQKIIGGLLLGEG